MAIEAVLQGMLERGRGQIVGISSLAAFRGMPVNAGYAATKAGLSTLLEGLRVELRGRGVDVTIVHPGFVRTPMIEEGGASRPFVLDVGPACRIILKGVFARRRYVNFPWPTVGVLRFAQALPAPLYDRLAAAVLLGGAERRKGVNAGRLARSAIRRCDYWGFPNPASMRRARPRYGPFSSEA